jgi:hypothetical protein
MMSELNNVRIRYGRVNEYIPKNTLVTLRDGNTIYFGIARCNTSAGDVFRKNIGKLIAGRRAAIATCESDKYDYLTGTNIQVHNSGLRGKVSSDNVVELLQTFDEIDQLLYNKAIEQETNIENVGV